MLILAHLGAVERHAGKHRLGHAGSLQLIPDLLINVKGDLGPQGDDGRLRIGAGALAGTRNWRVIKELLVNSGGVLVGEETADRQLLVNKVGHGNLLMHQPRVELRGQEPAVTQEHWRSWRTKWRAGMMRPTMRLGGRLRISLGQSSRAAHGAQMGGRW